MNYNPLDDYWHDFYFKRIEWYRDILKKQPGNTRALHEIKECKRMLYKKFLIEVDDQETQQQPAIQLALFE